MVFIRRKKKGNTFYYELVETRREDGKVKQHIIEYFPTLEAANLFCEKRGIRKIEKTYLIPPLLEKQLSKKLKELNSYRPLPETALKNLRDKFEIDVTYNSNAIEGNRLTLRETWLVVRKGMTIGGKTIEEHLEAKNHVEALQFLFELVEGKGKITEANVLRLHKLILDKLNPQWAGKYRETQVYISGAKHVPPAALQVPQLMKQLIKILNDKQNGTKAIVSASMVHHKLANIHPFVDGNGRLARLLLNLRLMQSGFPPIVLEKIQRNSYYSALEKADDGDLYPITTMIAKNVEKMLDMYLSAVKQNKK